MLIEELHCFPSCFRRGIHHDTLLKGIEGLIDLAGMEADDTKVEKRELVTRYIRQGLLHCLLGGGKIFAPP